MGLVAVPAFYCKHHMTVILLIYTPITESQAFTWLDSGCLYHLLTLGAERGCPPAGIEIAFLLPGSGWQE